MRSSARNVSKAVSSPVKTGTTGQAGASYGVTANAATPGTGRSLQPRLTSSAVDQQTNASKVRPTTPRRLSPINTSPSGVGGNMDTSLIKASLSPKAAAAGGGAASATKGSLSPTRANGGRGPSPRKKLGGNGGGAAGIGGIGTRVSRPSPVMTSNQKWSRTSPSVANVTAVNKQVAGVSDGLNSIGINDMRQQRSRVFRRAGQPPAAGLPDAASGAGMGNSAATSTSPGTLPNVTAGGGHSPKASAKKKRVGATGNRGGAGQGGKAKSGGGARSGIKPLVVVLDLDETLVHSTFHGSGARMYRQIEKRKSKIRRQVESFQLVLDDGDRVTVNKRPHVDEFMRALQAPEFESHVFTAALDSYASPVLDRLEKAEGSRLFARRMYRDSCTPTGMGTFAKDLDTLYPDLSRVVLVDNNPISLMKQPSNGILVPSFFDDPSDDVLPTVLDFLRSLADAPDVRPVLRALKG
jgi:Dullard-like phosphatase family protein